MIRKKLLCLIFVLFAVSTVQSQSFNKSKMDSLFTALAENNKAMGSISITQNGKEVYSRSIGYSQIAGNTKTPATTATKYRIGSVSKMFTATLVFQLIENGKLSTSTKLKTYFPEIPNADKITIGNLLNHRSGIFNFTNDPAYLTWMTENKSQEEIRKLIAGYTPVFEPGSKSEYSNSNYVLLGYIIEKITKQPYSTVLKENITDKIDLKNTYYGNKINTQKNESASYAFNAGWEVQPETDMSIPHGAGAIVSTPTDLTKFITALFNGKLVNTSSLNQMQTLTDAYGMGMFEFPFGTKKSYGHTGGIDGFSSMLGYFPEDKLAVAYTGNGQVYPVNEIMIGVLSIYYNVPYTIPDFKTITLTEQELDKYVGIYASSQLPLKITISKNKNVLQAQASGQSSFLLDATKKDVFTFAPAGITMEFKPEKNQFTLKQGGGSFLFTKEKE